MVLNGSGGRNLSVNQKPGKKEDGVGRNQANPHKARGKTVVCVINGTI